MQTVILIVQQKRALKDNQESECVMDIKTLAVFTCGLFMLPKLTPNAANYDIGLLSLL